MSRFHWLFLRIILGVLILAICHQQFAEAGPARIELAEGSILIGEIVGLKDGVYSVRLTSGDLVTVNEKSITGIQYSYRPEGRSESAASQGAPAPASADLRFAGSNTIGEKLVPELLQAYIMRQGGRDLQWLEGQPEDERHLVVRGTGGAKVPGGVHVAAHGSGTAFKALKEGKADIGMASRPVKESELLDLANLGNFKDAKSEHVIALDGLAVIVHPENPVRALSLEQIANIFACNISDWSQVGGSPGPIHLYARDEKSGTWDTFKEFVLDPNARSLCADAKRFESSSKLSEGVTSDPGGIGFIGLPYILNARPLRILECDLAYEPSAFSVKSEEYPLARRLFLYTPERPTSPFVGDFVEYALSDPGQEVAENLKFVSLAIQPDSANTQEARLVTAGLYSQSSEMLKDLLRVTRGASRLSVTFRFRTADDQLDSRAVRDLDRLVRFMKTPGAQGKGLFLLGFSDGRGDYQINLRLSQHRADAVADGLRARGIKVDLVKGFGEEAPVACNTNDIGAGRNRHVEVWLR